MAVAGYQVRIKKTTDGAWGSWVDVGNVLTHQFTGLDADTEYQAQVRAYDAVPNYSAASSTASATTDAGPPLLLDAVFAATGKIAKAAYSLRKLRNAYSGACLRVRRSSDDAEQDIGFDGSGVIDWAAAASFAGGSDLYVRTWYEQNGISGMDAEQATNANQPQLDTTNHEIVFESSRTTRLVTSGNIGISGDAAITTFNVAKRVSGTGMPYSFGSISIRAGYFQRWNSASAMDIGFSSANCGFSGGDYSSDSLVTTEKTPGTIDSSHQKAWQNGVALTMGSDPGGTPNIVDVPLVIGMYVNLSSYALNGTQKELIIFGDNFGGTDRGNIETDIIAAYSIS